MADIVHSSCAVNDTAHECCPLKLIDCLNWYDANCFLSKVTVHIRLLYLHISSRWVIVLVEVCSLPLLSSHSSTITSYSFQVVSMGSLVWIELLTMPSLLISSPSAWSGLFMKIGSSVHLFSVLFTFFMWLVHMMWVHSKLSVNKFSSWFWTWLSQSCTTKLQLSNITIWFELSNRRATVTTQCDKKSSLETRPSLVPRKDVRTKLHQTLFLAHVHVSVWMWD